MGSFVPVSWDCAQDKVQECQHGFPGNWESRLDMQPKDCKSSVVKRTDLWPAQHSFQNGEAKVEGRQR